MAEHMFIATQLIIAMKKDLMNNLILRLSAIGETQRQHHLVITIQKRTWAVVNITRAMFLVIGSKLRPVLTHVRFAALRLATDRTEK